MNPFELCRDDGPVARALGATVGRSVRLPSITLLALGTLPLLLVIAIDGTDASNAAAGVVVGWLVVAGGASRGRPHTDSLRWAIPPSLRLAEYATVLWLGALAGGSGPAPAFALLAVLAFRHYDLWYRLRFLGVGPPGWVGDAAGGWEGRLLAGYVLLVAGALPAGFFVGAGLLGALFVGEGISGWTRAGVTLEHANEGVEE